MSTLLENLNSEQKAAVECVEGPVLVVAGAGSGKTRVLTTRIAYLIEQGVSPDRILALTFTKKAAGEMKERIAVMVGERSARRLWMGTFHSVFIRFLREFSGLLGYPQDFTIYDQSDQTSAVKACIKELKLDESTYKPRDVLSRISKAKNNLVTAADYAANGTLLTNDRAARKPEIYKIYQLYDKLCKSAGVMDFDDILVNTNILFRDFPDALASVRDRFSHILVDEYQDTNFAQYVIIKRLSAVHRNICVVGDDSQSIYAFRGAQIQNILNFAKDYPDYKKFELRSNYRSTRMIVEASNSLIGKNSERIPKRDCISMGAEGEKIRLVRAYTEMEEASLITEEILSRMRSDHAQYQDFAILYRTNAQSRSIEEALRRRNLPYKVWSGNSFFDRAEVKDMMAYFKLAVNPNDEESFKRIVNVPARGIGKTSVEKLLAAAREKGLSLFLAAYENDLDRFGLRPSDVAKIRQFCDMILAAHKKCEEVDAYEMADSLARESGYLAFYKNDNTVEAQARAANIEELLNSAAVFREQRREEIRTDLLAEREVEEISDSELPVVRLGEFLESTALLSNADVDEEDADNKIALMTVHTAKGLEFPYVLVAGMEENLFPSGGSLITEREMEEERRLFYVALTRAKSSVVVSFAVSRMRNGKHESNAPSRFLKDIDRKYFENPQLITSRSDVDDEPEEPRFGGTFRFGNRSHYSWKDSSSPSGSWHGPSAGAASERPSRGSSYGASAARPSSGSYGAAVAHPSSGASSDPASPSEKRRLVSSRTGRALTEDELAHVRGLKSLPSRKEDFVPTPMSQLSAGDRVEHDRFGAGIIDEITGAIPELKAKITFEKYGTKILLLKYAKIRRLPLAD